MATAVICLAAVLLVAIFVGAPERDAQAVGGQASTCFGAAVFAHLGVTLIASTALFALVGLIGPIIRATTGFTGSGIAAMQFLVGLSSLLGVRLGAALVTHQVRFALIVPFVLLLVSLGILVSSLAAGAMTALSITAMVASVSLGARRAISHRHLGAVAFGRTGG
ncbi:hypothetical protein [Breoghania sp.]|uniref:hypothetical protein n=1 Tax=Breoghania sp. TaxID=2065378 RepID=UPI002607D47C|nr:hypothetical protein [Breoghania sp.]MDJ0933485.1 hypothetical protein [Breoghania sp.]